MINGVLAKFGVTMLMDPKFGYWGLIILMNWQLIGYIMIIYIAGLQNVSTDILEAARIDGATSMQTLTKVTIPMVMPSITICLFLTIANSFKMFDQNLALTNGLYYMFVFSMVVPLQMIMFTMSKLADMLHLNNPVGMILALFFWAVNPVIRKND